MACGGVDAPGRAIAIPQAGAGTAQVTAKERPGMHDMAPDCHDLVRDHQVGLLCHVPFQPLAQWRRMVSQDVDESTVIGNSIHGGKINRIRGEGVPRRRGGECS